MEDGEGGVILALAEVESEVPNGGRDGAVGVMPRTFCAPVNWCYGLALRLGKGFVLCQTSLG